MVTRVVKATVGMGLEGALAFIAAAELLEVTPLNLRHREAELLATASKRRGARLLSAVATRKK